MTQSHLPAETVIGDVEHFLAEQYINGQGVPAAQPRDQHRHYAYWRWQALKLTLSLNCAVLAVWLSYRVVALAS